MLQMSENIAAITKQMKIKGYWNDLEFKIICWSQYLESSSGEPTEWLWCSFTEVVIPDVSFTVLHVSCIVKDYLVLMVRYIPTIHFKSFFEQSLWVLIQYIYHLSSYIDKPQIMQRPRCSLLNCNNVQNNRITGIFNNQCNNILNS